MSAAPRRGKRDERGRHCLDTHRQHLVWPDQVPAEPRDQRPQRVRHIVGVDPISVQARLLRFDRVQENVVERDVHSHADGSTG